MIYSFLAAILSTILFQNVVTTHTVGLDLALSNPQRRVKEAFKYGSFIFVITTILFIIIYPVNRFILEPNNLTYLLYLLTALAIIGIHILGEYILIKTKKEELKEVFFRTLFNSSAIFITILGIQESTWLSAFSIILGSGLGVTLVLMLLSTIQIKLDASNESLVVKGLPIILIVLGMMGIVFKGLSGIF